MPNLKNRNQNQPKKIRRDIQALRAFAVMAVVLYHLWPERLVGGFTGVDIFFVISGYLMTTSIMGRLTPLVESQNINPKSVFHVLTEFYARRIKRLVPAALVTLVGILGLAAATNNLTVIIDNAKNVVSAATFWENWSLAEQSVDYLHSADAPVASQHFWSLSLEEQFYLMWPLLLIASALIMVNVVVYYKRSKISGAILPITLITVASAIYGYWLTKNAPSIAYFSTPARVWELMMGGIIAFLPTLKNYDLKLLLPHTGLALCLYSILFITGDGFPGWHALIPTIGVALIILGGVDRVESKFAFDSIFQWRPIQWIGDISYSIYLWHWPLIVLLPVILHVDIDGQHGRLFKVAIIMLSLALAYLSYRFIEEPTRKAQINTRYIYIIFITATVAVVCGGFGLKYYGEQQTIVRLNSMHSAATDTNNICFGARALLHKDTCDKPLGKINPRFLSLGQQDDFRLRIQDTRTNCFNFYILTKNSTDIPQYCSVGDLRSEQTILLIGDSHADQYINTFNDIGKKNHYKVIVLDIVGCKLWKDINKSKLCQDRMNFITSSSLINSSSHIILSTLFRNYSDVADFMHTLKDIPKEKTFLLQDIPLSTAKRIAKCSLLRVECTSSRKAATSANYDIIEKLIDNRLLSKGHAIDTSDMFCDHSQCYSSIGGVPVYYGSSLDAGAINAHLSASYSLSLAPLLEQKLEKVGVL